MQPPPVPTWTLAGSKKTPAWWRATFTRAPSFVPVKPGLRRKVSRKQVRKSPYRPLPRRNLLPPPLLPAHLRRLHSLRSLRLLPPLLLSRSLRKTKTTTDCVFPAVLLTECFAPSRRHGFFNGCICRRFKFVRYFFLTDPFSAENTQKTVFDVSV